MAASDKGWVSLKLINPKIERPYIIILINMLNIIWSLFCAVSESVFLIEIEAFSP